MKTWKQAVHTLFLLCGLLLLFAPDAKAQLTDDGKVDVVQAHFQFTNPDGSPISHNVLKTVLQTPLPNASTGTNYTVTYLDAGLLLSNYMDQKQKFDSGNYSEYTIDYDRLLVEDLSAWLNLFGIQTWFSATDVYDFIASHGSTFKSQLTQNLEDSSLDIFNAVGSQYTATQAVTETYGQLGSDIYGKFGAATDGIYALYDTLEAFRQVTVNNMLAVYMRNCFGTDDESDANAWLVAEVEAGNSLVRDDLDRIHLDCRYAYALKQKLAVIQPDLDQYTSDVKALLVGGVKITYTPDAYALHAPVQVNMNASGSTGTFGSSITSYQWTVDGSQVSSSSTYTGTYFAVGQHTVQCTVTDSTGTQITGKDTINVGPPPIQVTNFNANDLKATFTTPTNSLVNNPNGCTWDFGDGSAPVVSSTNTPVPHTFPSGQIYRVTLTETTFIDTTVTGTTSVNFTPNPTDVYSYALTNSEDWGISGSPYRIHGTLTIPVGVRLTLEPGVVLQFDNRAGINVYGKLISNGQSSPKQRVYLTSYRDNSPPSLPSPGTDAGQSGDWQGLTFFPGSFGTLTACVIREALNGAAGDIPVIAGAIFDRSPVSTNSPIALTVSGNVFNASGLSILNSNSQAGSRDVSVSGNSFSSGSSATFSYSLGLLTMSGNTSGDGVPVPFNLGVANSSGLSLSKTNAWTPQPGVHLINYGLFVMAGATLNLGSGLVIQNYVYSSSYVAGDLRGPTSGSPAILTALGDASPYGGTDSAGNSDWPGVAYAAGLTANLQGIVIRHAGYGVQGLPTIITGGTFDRCDQAIGVDRTSTDYYQGTPRTIPLTLSGNTFLSSRVSTNSPVALTVSGNVFSGSGLSILNSNSQAGSRDVSVSGNSFSSGSSATFSYSLGLLTMSGNTSGDGVPVPFNLGLANSSSLSLSGANTWTPQPGVHLINYGTNIAAGAILNLGSGLVIQNYVYSSSYVAGDLRGPTSGSPAILTALGDASPYGGTDSAGNSDWPGVAYAAGLTANLSAITIKHALVGLTADTANLNNCTFTQNSTGVLVNNGGGTYRNCSFTQNRIAVQNNSTNVVDARGNFWGDPTGPYNAKSNPGGLGNAVSDYVLFGTLPPVLISLAFPSPVPGGTVVTATVTLSGAALSDTVVGLSSSDSSIVRLHRAVIVPAGSASATFPINTYRSHVTKTVTIQAALDQVVQAMDLTISGR